MSLLLALQGGSGTFVYTATGGIVFAGAAAVSKSKDAVASGGIAFSGAALLARSKAYVASGGISFAGAASLAKAKAFAPSGGIVYAGVAVTSVVGGSVVYTYTASGGLVFGGTGLAQFAAASVLAGGRGAPKRLKDSPWWPYYLAIGTKVWAYEASGGIVFSGAAETLHEPVPVQAIEVIARARIGFGGGAASECRTALDVAREADAEDLRLYAEIGRD